ncbi:MAG: D-alanine--D-alanine ligase [Gammaproteobacteria bacterium]|nr:D-alanine--D-alanine ligase [Gammaproteobacteria bacterium]
MNKIDKNQLIEEAGRVAVLMGGTSAEREISLLSGAAVLGGLESAGLNVIGIDAGNDLIDQLQVVRPDRVFNMLHGRGGEDGAVQGLLNSLQIPFTGSDILGSALSMDKLKSKLIWKQLGLETPDFQVLHADSDWPGVMDQLGVAVVKPVNEGSSIGMSIARTAAQLKEAFYTAQEFDFLVLAEQHIEGEEYSLSILQQIVLPAIQLKTDREFYDFDAKYCASNTEYICPVDLSVEPLDKLNSLSMSAFNCLGCEGWGRVDVMRNTEGEFLLLEVNTVPGMTDHSLVPMAAKQAGISYEDLLLQILFAKGSRGK